MKILVVGGGGREHCLVQKLKESPHTSEVYCCPGNGGIAADAHCVNLQATDVEGVTAFCTENHIDLVVVAPDDPLARGMVDSLEQKGIKTFGPTKTAAEIESSKVFSKGLMKQFGIPTAQYEVFENCAAAVEAVRKADVYPVVIKADGLALGKGVVIAEDFTQAQRALSSMMEEEVFGTSGKRVVIEEFMTGPEVSVLAFTDSVTMRPMVSSMDHKRALDGDKGLNTGGMGTIAPNPYYTPEIEKVCMETIFMPTLAAMNELGRPFKGCLYFGLMLTPQGPKVIEYNCRFGDPETQVVLPLLESDLVEIMLAIHAQTLDKQEIVWSKQHCACVVLASGGYPQAYQKGIPIHGLNTAGQCSAEGVTLCHAGTKQVDGQFVTDGGRVLGVCAKGISKVQALQKAYEGVAGISFAGYHYRKDIGRLPPDGYYPPILEEQTV